MDSWICRAMPHRSRSWACAALALVCLLLACAPSQRPRSDLLVLATGNVFGYIEPCGCVAGQIGGIDRIVGYVRRERAAHPNSVFVDSGDLFAADTEPGVALAQQLPLKAQAFFGAWASAGCSAVAVGETDLVLGVETLRALSEEHGVPLLCGNLADADGELVFAESVVVERANQRIGFFSLLAPQLVEAKVKSPARIDVASLVAEQGLQLLDWRARARAIVDDLAPRTDLIVCISHLGFALNRELAESDPRIAAVFGGHFDDSKKETYFTGNTPVLVSFVKGARVQRIEWWWEREEEYFLESGFGPLIDVSAHVAAEVEAEVQRFELMDLADREALLGTKKWQEKRARASNVLASIERGSAELGPWPTGNLFAHMPVPMHRGLVRDEFALREVDAYHQRLDEHWEAKKQVGRDATATYPSPESCAACHPEQYDFWLATRHSKAFSTLEATRQEMDAECIGCHTVGYGQREGFARPSQHQGFENVQCAACHGSGQAHVAGGVSYLDPQRILPGNVGCAVCHNDEHDPKFAEQAEQKLALVACPPMARAGQGSAALLASLRKAALILNAQQPVPFDRLSDVYWKAGDLVAAADAAERWLDADPNSVTARLTLAERYLDQGRVAESVPLFESVTKRQARNWRAWSGLGVALLPTDPERALAAGLEAYSLQGDRPERIAFVAWCLQALGRGAEVGPRVEQHLAAYPEQRAELEALLRTGR